MSCSGDGGGYLGQFRPIPVSRDMMREVDPVIRDDGRVLKRYELMFGGKGTGLFYVEDPLDRCPQYEIVEIKPMEMPSTALLYLDYVYGKTKP